MGKMSTSKSLSILKNCVFQHFFYVIQELIKSASKPWARGIQIGLKDTMQTGTACRFLILFKYFIREH